MLHNTLQFLHVNVMCLCLYFYQYATKLILNLWHYESEITLTFSALGGSTKKRQKDVLRANLTMDIAPYCKCLTFIEKLCG